MQNVPVIFMMSVRYLRHECRDCFRVGIATNTIEQKRLWEATLTLGPGGKLKIIERRQLDPRLTWLDTVNFEMIAAEQIVRLYYC